MSDAEKHHPAISMDQNPERDKVERRARAFQDSWQRRLCVVLFWIVSAPWWAFLVWLTFEEPLPTGFRGPLDVQILVFWLVCVLLPGAFWGLYRLGLWIAFGKHVRLALERKNQESDGGERGSACAVPPSASLASSSFGQVGGRVQSVSSKGIESLAPKRQWPMIVWFIYGPAATAVLGKNAWLIWLPIGIMAFRDWTAKRTVSRIRARQGIQDFAWRIYVPVLLSYLLRQVILYFGVCVVLALMGGLPNNLSGAEIGKRVGAAWATVLIPSLFVVDVPFWIKRRLQRIPDGSTSEG